MSDTVTALWMLTGLGVTYAVAAIAWAHWEGRRLDKMKETADR